MHEIWRRDTVHEVRMYEGIEEYLISVINGLIEVFPYPPIARDKYPEFTISEAQLAAF